MHTECAQKNVSRTLATTAETLTTVGAHGHTAAHETTGTSGGTKNLSLFQSSCVCVSPVELTDGSSNGNASVFYYIEANTFDSKQIIFETKRTH